MSKIGLIFLSIAIIIVVLTSLAMSTQNPFGRPDTVFTPTPPAVIKEIQQLQRLETATFTLEKIIEAGTNGNAFQEVLYGDRILLIAHGQVIAGLDLSEVKEEDITVSGTSVSLKLPAPKILVTALDSQQTRVYDRRMGLLSKGDKELESQARAQAEKVITAAACEGLILEKASENANTQLTALLKALGFTEVKLEIPQGECSVTP